MGCGGAPSGLTVTVVAGSEIARPTALSVSWLSDRGTIYQKDQVPVSAGETLASIFVELDRSDTSDRRVLVRGTGPGKGTGKDPGSSTSIGAIRIQNAAASQTVVLTLRATIADGDGDGIPDVIDDCRDGACSPRADAGVPEDAEITPYPDGAAEEEDASTPADAGATIEPDAGNLPPDLGAPPPDAGAEPSFPAIPGLVGLWRMNEGKGTAVGDGAPGGNAGTIMRPTGSDWAQGHQGSALSLAGAAWLSVPSAKGYDATAGLTLSAWVLWPKAIPAAQVIMARQSGVGSQNAFWLGMDANRLHFSVQDEGVNTPAPSGRWVHVAGTYDGSRAILYLDGVPAIAGVASARVAPTSRDVSIGADLNGSDQSAGTSMFVGRLDEVAIFNRALTASEIGALAK
jgi:hypothetical protein